MPRCPNCFYELVLLGKRRKYKCAKCGRLFPQREIDDKEFREQNKKRRIGAKVKMKKEARKEYRKKYNEKNPDKVRKWAREYYERNKNKPEFIKKKRENHKKWRRKNPEKIKEYNEKYKKNKELHNAQKREYWAKNREHILEKRKENYQKRKPQILVQQKLYRQNNKTLSRIKHLRNQQKLLALRKLESGDLNLSILKI